MEDFFLTPHGPSLQFVIVLGVSFDGTLRLYGGNVFSCSIFIDEPDYPVPDLREQCDIGKRKLGSSNQLEVHEKKAEEKFKLIKNKM
jgi:hypothetical protein